MKTLLLFAASCGAVASALAADLASSAASSAASAGSASLGSASESLRSSGNSSTGPRKMADGDYRVIEIADAEGRPGEVQLTLHAPADGASGTAWHLRLPRIVAEREGLAPGRLVRAAQQPYGVAFALAGQRRPFFLVLADDWQRELPAHPVRAAGDA